jgi:hypothetical protein
MAEMTESIAIVTGHESMVEAFRVAKEMRNLSNDFCDDVGGLTKGHTDKILGPTRVKNISPMTIDLFCTMFAVKFVMVCDVFGDDVDQLLLGMKSNRSDHQLAPKRQDVESKIIALPKPTETCGADALASPAAPAVSRAHLRVVQTKNRGRK